MARRKSRLASSALGVRSGRLKTAMKQEVEQMSYPRLKDFVEAKKSAIVADPILSTYHDFAVKELERRKGLQKKWGKEAPKMPSPLAVSVGEAMQRPARWGYRVVKFYDDLARGKFATDMVFATNFLLDRLSDFHKRGVKAEERWSHFSKVHGLTKKTENDYLKDGYDLKDRLKHDLHPLDMKRAVSDYRKGYKSVILVPTKVDGSMFYSLMTKDVRT